MCCLHLYVGEENSYEFRVNIFIRGASKFNRKEENLLIGFHASLRQNDAKVDLDSEIYRKGMSSEMFMYNVGIHAI